MLKKVFVFPESNYLREKWWHRLATVIFYFCLAFIVVFTIKTLILDPYSSCITVKYFDFSKPSDLDCGTSAYNYAYSTYADEPITNILGSAAFIFIALYIAAIMPSLLYRMFLFVGKGATWRDSANVT
jgi:hypothetical protein